MPPSITYNNINLYVYCVSDVVWMRMSLVGHTCFQCMGYGAECGRGNVRTVHYSFRRLSICFFSIIVLYMYVVRMHSSHHCSHFAHIYIYIFTCQWKNLGTENGSFVCRWAMPHCHIAGAYNNTHTHTCQHTTNISFVFAYQSFCWPIL